MRGCRLQRSWLAAAVVLGLSRAVVLGQEDGDALQLQTYLVESASERPDVSDGSISATGNLDDWKSAYARQIACSLPAGATREPTLFFASDADSLYIAVALPNDNNGAGQGFFMYFDLDNDGVLDGTPSAPGEYAISAVKANATAATFIEYGWDGTAWVANTTPTPGLREGFVDNGSGGNHVYNFEMQIPFLSSAANAGQAYLDAAPGDEIGIMVTLALQAGTYYWDGAGTSVTDASMWGDLQINTAQASPRRLASLYAKTYVPTVTDGNITDDPNWKYAYEKTVVFTDFSGDKLANSRLLIKEDAANLYFGVRITDGVAANGDYLQIYFDQGDNGGALNYRLNPTGSARKDDAARVAGNDALTDLYFDGSAWVTDGVANVAGGANHIAGSAWEFELAKPLTTADANDLSITSGEVVGILFRYHDADSNRDYWWSGTINNDVVKVDVSTNYNALGWGELATGGPFVQPLYPQQNDIISGTYVLMLHTEDQNGIAGIDSVDYRVTDLNDNIVINYSASTRLTKVDNTASGLWVSTFNSNTVSTPDGDYNIVFRVLDDDGIRVTSPVRVQINNTGMVGGPTVAVLNLTSGNVVAGDSTIRFTVNPTGANDVTQDSVQVRIDGGTWGTVDVPPPVTGGTGYDTLRSSLLVDGVHTIRYRAKDSGNQAWGYSEQIIFNVDNQASAARVTITAPADSAVKSDTVDIVFTVVAPTGRSIASTEIAVDGFNWTATTTDSTHRLDTKGYPDGTHLVQVRVTDDLDRVGYSQPVAIIVSNAPTVSLDTPAGGATVAGRVALAYTASGSAAIDSLWLVVDGRYSTGLALAGNDTLDTGPLADGEHTLQVRVLDADGRRAASEIITVLVRNTPIAVIDTPLAGSAVSGEVRLVYTLTPKGTALIDSAWLLVDGGFGQALSVAGSDTLNTTVLADGEHSIQVVVLDDQGKVGMSSVVTLVVRNSPTAVIDTPLAGGLISGEVRLVYTLTPMGTATVDSAWLLVDGGHFQALNVTGADTLNTTVLPDGEHPIQVVVLDDQGKAGRSEAITLSVRNAPDVTIVAPAGGAKVWGDLALTYVLGAKGTASIDSVWLMVDGAYYQDLAVGGADTLATTALEDGEHTIQVRAIDDQGKRGASEVLTLLVRNSPEVTVVSPAAGAAVADTLIVTFSVTVPGVAAALDTADIDSSFLSVDGGAYHPTTSRAGDIIPTRALRDGSHIFKLRVYCNGGKIGVSDERLVVVDNSAPMVADPKVVYPDGATAARNGAQVLVTALVKEIVTLLDADSGVVLTSAEVDTSGPPAAVMVDDGTGGDQVAGDNVYSARVTVSSGANGSASFSVRATDSLGNAVTLTGAVKLDNRPPTVRFTLRSPVDSVVIDPADTTYFEYVVMNAEYFDTTGGSGLKAVWVTVTTGADSNIANSPIVLSAEHRRSSVVVNLAGGLNVIRLVAEDRAGNIDTVEERIMNLDLEAPEIIEFRLVPEPDTVSVPRLSLTYFDRLILKARYSDGGGSGLSRVYVTVVNDSGDHVNNSPIELSAEDTLEVSRIIQLVPGVNYVTMVARDHGGNETMARDTVEYREPKATAVVTKKGGTVESPDGAGVVIPPDALLYPMEVTIRKVLAIDQPKPVSSDLTLLNVAHEFGPDGTVFRKQVTITLSYTEADLDRDQDGARDIDASKLTVVYWDGTTWVKAGNASHDRTAMSLSVTVNHFTMFDLAQDNASAPTKLRAYWTSNPVVAGNGGGEFVAEIADAGTVNLRILDLAGDVVCTIPLGDKGGSVAAGRTYRARWSGLNVADRFAGAGLYVYVFSFTRKGSDKPEQIIRKPIGLLLK